jgi:hypothetical protein|tara:strand:+ start:372 stop:1184 length:813 start_codon:yes stop_codon:yes gene_type:complete
MGSNEKSCITSSGVDLAQEGRYLVQWAAQKGIPLRLTGGVAIWMRASDEARVALSRQYPDLDLVAHSKHSLILQKLLTNHGYEPERRFNALHGNIRLFFHAADNSYHLDIFLDQFQMSHKLDLGRRLEVEELTIPTAELLLTKLQIAELNQKDASDTAMLLFDHELANDDGPGKLNTTYVAEPCAKDWGLFTTVSDNLGKSRELLPELLSDDYRRNLVATRIDELRCYLETSPKTLRWKLRAKIGRRMSWHERVEEFEHLPKDITAPLGS